MREQSQLASPPQQPVSIPLEKIQPHPKLALRFRYSVESLAALILAAASGNVPNGQLEPGRVVPTEDGLGYYVYVGVKRFLALKLLFEKTHDVRFAAFNAYVDTNLSPLRMFVIAKMENEEGKGEREGLSVLEEVSGIGRIRDSVKPGELDEGLRRLHDLSEKLGEERLKKLYELERVAHFKFRVAHLERLCRIEGDEKDFYLAAASAAGYRFTGDDIEEAVEARSAAYNLEWFKDLFPSYSSEAPPPPTSPSSGHDQDGNQGGEGEAEGKGREEQGSGHLEVHLEEVVLAACPKCEGENMVKLDGEVKATQIPPDPDGKRRTVVAESVDKVDCECFHCDGKFYAFAKHLEGREYAVESSLSKRFREPKTIVEAFDVRYDFGRGVWQKIVDGKIAGDLNPTPGKRKVGEARAKQQRGVTGRKMEKER